MDHHKSSSGSVHHFLSAVNCQELHAGCMRVPESSNLNEVQTPQKGEVEDVTGRYFRLSCFTESGDGNC